MPLRENRPPNSAPWSWQGMVATMLSIAVFVATNIFTLGLSVKIALGKVDIVSAGGVGIVTGILSTLIGAVAAFLGKSQLSHDNPGADADRVDPEEVW